MQLMHNILIAFIFNIYNYKYNRKKLRYINFTSWHLQWLSLNSMSYSQIWKKSHKHVWLFVISDLNVSLIWHLTAFELGMFSAFV